MQHHPTYPDIKIYPYRYHHSFSSKKSKQKSTWDREAEMVAQINVRYNTPLRTVDADYPSGVEILRTWFVSFRESMKLRNTSMVQSDARSRDVIMNRIETEVITHLKTLFDKDIDPVKHRGFRNFFNALWGVTGLYIETRNIAQTRHHVYNIDRFINESDEWDMHPEYHIVVSDIGFRTIFGMDLPRNLQACSFDTKLIAILCGSWLCNNRASHT